ncbi:PIG-L deacetylase family protein [Actinoallomurus acaciae]|uniref:PIG-L deacetylase family protein n=1 Tax=Actinoallomurus acaciae TaxID=502577 RepID=A0ABV5Y7T1_9ACTN
MNPIEAPGTAEPQWRAWPGLRDLPTLDVSGWRSAAIVAAHPDDEVLGAGGLMAMLADRGVRLRLIAVTDGEASHPGRDIAARRIAETTCALKHIGDCEVLRLRLPDSGVRDDELAARLPDLLAGFEVCLAPWENDVHPDHEAAGRAALTCDIPVLRFPIWTWHWARPADPGVPWERAARVPLPPPILHRKRSAIDCFTSQTEGPDPILPPGVLEHFTRPAEVLVR